MSGNEWMRERERDMAYERGNTNVWVIAMHRPKGHHYEWMLSFVECRRVTFRLSLACSHLLHRLYRVFIEHSRCLNVRGSVQPLFIQSLHDDLVVLLIQFTSREWVLYLCVYRPSFDVNSHRALQSQIPQLRWRQTSKQMSRDRWMDTKMNR